MLWGKPGETVESILEDAPTGLAGTIAVRVVDPSVNPPTVLLVRTTAHIYEVAPGVYVHPFVAPPGADGQMVLILWDLGDPNGDTFSEELFVSRVPPQSQDLDYLPTPTTIGTLLRARTVDKSGAEIGTFTADTRPTRDQASEQISLAVDDLTMLFGTNIPTKLFSSVRTAIAIRAAMFIELGYWPEQVTTGRSPYEQLKALYDQMRPSLVLAVQQAQSADPDEDIEGVGMAEFDFGSSSGVVGLGTLW